MYKYEKMEDRKENEPTLFFISHKSPVIGAFILINIFSKILCYQ